MRSTVPRPEPLHGRQQVVAALLEYGEQPDDRRAENGATGPEIEEGKAANHQIWVRREKLVPLDIACYLYFVGLAFSVNLFPFCPTTSGWQSCAGEQRAVL